MTYSRPGVYVTERLLPAPITVTGTANAAGAVIGAFSTGPEDVTLVTNWGEFTSLYGGHSVTYPATFGVSQFFNNGGTDLYVRRVLGADAGNATVAIAPATGVTTVGSITALDKGAEGTNLRAQFSFVSGNYYNLTVYKEGPLNNSGTTTGDFVLERFNNIVLNDPTSSDYVETVVNQASNYIQVALTSNSIAPGTGILPLTGSNLDGDAPLATDYTDAVSDFDIVDRPLVIFAPEVYSKFVVDGSTAGDAKIATQAVQDGIVAWASSTNGFAVLDTTPGLTVADAVTYAAGRAETSQAAVYYPNVYISDPLGRSNGSLRLVGPAGSVAGLYLQTDKSVGPFKAPAGLQANIAGAIALEKTFTNAELDTLNAANQPLNAIRNIPGAGIVVMGARTLLQDGTANKYVNMRRSLIYIEKQLKDLTQFALFENNSSVLWGRIRTVLTVFLNEYRNQGGLRGSTPGDSFYVLCDNSNNDELSIQNGEVHIQIGVALQYPAEFVVINLSQQTAA